MAKISIPFNLEEPNFENKENRLKEKEIKVKEHLEEMSELTRNLSYNDIKLLKKNDLRTEEKSLNREENNIDIENEKDKKQRERNG